MPILVLLGIGVVVFVVVAMIVRLFFTFALLAIWDTPTSGGDAIRASYRLVKDHFWSVVGLSLLFALIVVGAAIAGLLACCVGLYFTLPIVSIWYTGALIYLYRSWTGQALVQPVLQASPTAGAPGGEGPIPPSAIEPPSTM